MGWIPHLLLVFVFLTACGSSSIAKKTSTKETEEAGKFFVSVFTPAEGGTLADTVTLAFSDFPERTRLAALTHYVINCGSGNLHAKSVDSESGFSSVTVTLPDMDLSSGTSCTFTVSSNLFSESGDRLTGTREVHYTMP